MHLMVEQVCQGGPVQAALHAQHAGWRALHSALQQRVGRRPAPEAAPLEQGTLCTDNQETSFIYWLQAQSAYMKCSHCQGDLCCCTKRPTLLLPAGPLVHAIGCATRACALTPLMPKELVPARLPCWRASAPEKTPGAGCSGMAAVRPQSRRQSEMAAAT